MKTEPIKQEVKTSEEKKLGDQQPEDKTKSLVGLKPYTIEYDNDTGSDDGYFREYWTVSNEDKSFECESDVDAEFLRDTLNRVQTVSNASPAGVEDPSIKDLKAELLTLQGKYRRLEDKSRVLVERLDIVHADEAFKSVWILNQMRNGEYTGAKYEKEFEALKEALASCQHEFKKGNV